MKRIKKAFKKNRVLFTLAIILIVCFCLIIYGLIKYFYTGLNKNAYGDRLEGLVKLNKNIDEDIDLLYKDYTNIKDIKLNVHGKIVYIIFDFEKEIGLEEAKTISLKSLDVFSDKEKNNYDIQIILTSENELFPTMGYKNSSNDKVIWIKS